jgi:hypothetical protein
LLIMFSLFAYVLCFYVSMSPYGSLLLAGYSLLLPASSSPLRALLFRVSYALVWAV